MKIQNIKKHTFKTLKKTETQNIKGGKDRGGYNVGEIGATQGFPNGG